MRTGITEGDYIYLCDKNKCSQEECGGMAAVHIEKYDRDTEKYYGYANFACRFVSDKQTMIAGSTLEHSKWPGEFIAI